MSRTTNVIVIPNIDHRINRREFEEFLEECGRDYYLGFIANMGGLQKALKEEGADVGLQFTGKYRFKKVDELAGGNRGFEAEVYMAAYKYFGIEDFINKVRAWVEAKPSGASVQLFIKDEDDISFSLITLCA